MSKNEECISIDEEMGFWGRILIAKEDIPTPKSTQTIQSFINLSSQLQQKYNVQLQLSLPDAILSQEHIKLILYHILQAFKLKGNISNQANLEFLLYLSGQRQIKRALELVGLKKEEPISKKKEFLIVVFGPHKTLPLAIREVLTQLDLFEIQSVQPKQGKNLHTYFEKENINPLQIHRMLKLLYLTVPNSSNLQELITQITEKNLLRMALNLANERMCQLFLLNLKESSTLIEAKF
jgi:tRNA threonylcarbamoyladenosine modification (KEOPS) complex Cgi121 subunit